MIMVVGDSQAESNSYSLFALAKERNLDLLIISQPGNRYFVKKCQNNAPCSDELTKLILKLRPNYLIINNLWLDSMLSLNDSNSFYQEYFKPFAGLLDNGVGKIIIVKSIPVPSNFGSYFTLYNHYVGKNYKFRLIGDQSTRSSMAIDRLKSNFSGIDSIDPRSLICKELECSVTNMGLSMYRNATHLSQKGSELLGKYYALVID
jgi:hypothetical protein